MERWFLGSCKLFILKNISTKASVLIGTKTVEPGGVTVWQESD